MKKVYLYVVIALCLILIGGLIDHLLFVRPLKTQITIIPKDTIIIEKWKDTLTFKPLTPIESIPVRTKKFKGAIPIITDGGIKKEIKYEGSFTYRGIAYGYSLQPYSDPIVISITKTKRTFPIRPYLSFSAIKLFPTTKNDYDYYLFSELGVCGRIQQKMEIDLFISAGFLNKNVIPGAGVKITFFAW